MCSTTCAFIPDMLRAANVLCREHAMAPYQHTKSTFRDRDPLVPKVWGWKTLDLANDSGFAAVCARDSVQIDREVGEEVAGFKFEIPQPRHRETEPILAPGWECHAI
jgi:hypothetical protein